MDGGELFDRVVQKTFYSEEEARNAILVILKAVNFMHNRNIVHRDLKPGRFPSHSHVVHLLSDKYTLSHTYLLTMFEARLITITYTLISSARCPDSD